MRYLLCSLFALALLAPARGQDLMGRVLQLEALTAANTKAIADVAAGQTVIVSRLTTIERDLAAIKASLETRTALPPPPATSVFQGVDACAQLAAGGCGQASFAAGGCGGNGADASAGGCGASGAGRPCRFFRRILGLCK